MTRGPIDILLIEDNASDAELTVHAFQKYSRTKHIHIVRDGAEALDFVHRTGAYANRDEPTLPKLILLDLKLPLVDGHYVLRQIRANPAVRHVPVVVLTSSREARDIYQSYQLGISSYIVKPVNFDAFIETAKTIAKYWLELNQPLVD
ncbi:response regulator [Nitrospira sp. Nam74]